MTQRTNEYGQPIGELLSHWSPRPAPTGVTLKGQFCQLEPLNAARHAADLFAAYQTAPDGRNWTYLFSGPFANEDDYRRHAEAAAQSTDPRHFAVIDSATGKPVGTLSLMRIDPTHGCIEVGNVTFSPLLQQTPASTEAQFLLMAYAFDTLGYRRYEWKCDSLVFHHRHRMACRARRAANLAERGQPGRAGPAAPVACGHPRGAAWG